MQQVDEQLLVAAKPNLIRLPTPELNLETPAHLLDDDITPVERLFARNTGRMPDLSPAALARWTLTIDGCVRAPRTWTLAALTREFPPASVLAVIECAGNGRAFFPDPAGTVLWEYGAAGCVRWTGVRLADLLACCEVQSNAVYTGHYSSDLTLDGKRAAISRGVPIAKALAPETLVAYELNGAPIPPLHGGPLRLVAPGYPGSAWQKWLTRIAIRDREHDGERMQNLHYRMPRLPLRYGDKLDPDQFDVITDIPVRSLITSLPENFRVPARSLRLRGHAWSGHVPVARVELSSDGGRSWAPAELQPAPERFAWHRFEAALDLLRGPCELIVRATDANGSTQPLDSVPWNPRGYCNNRAQRVSGTVF